MAAIPLLGESASGFSPDQAARVDAIINDFNATTARMDAILESMKKKEFVEYTLFVSGVRNGRMSELEGKNTTDDIAILFDAVVRHSYEKSYTKTSHAVESKAKTSDHVVTEDGTISFTAKVTSSPLGYDDRNYFDMDTDPDNPMEARRPEKAVEILERIADSHQTVTLVTEDNILKNYVITKLKIDRTAEEGASITIDITLSEFRFSAATKTVMARTTDPKKAGNKNDGSKQTAAGGAADDANKGKRPSPYVGGSKDAFEWAENKGFGTTDFSGKAGAQIKPTGPKFDPGSLMRP